MLGCWAGIDEILFLVLSSSSSSSSLFGVFYFNISRTSFSRYPFSMNTPRREDGDKEEPTEEANPYSFMDRG